MPAAVNDSRSRKQCVDQAKMHIVHRHLVGNSQTLRTDGSQQPPIFIREILCAGWVHFLSFQPCKNRWSLIRLKNYFFVTTNIRMALEDLLQHTFASSRHSND